jgi:hypothetical protein
MLYTNYQEEAVEVTESLEVEEAVEVMIQSPKEAVEVPNNYKYHYPILLNLNYSNYNMNNLYFYYIQ